MIPGRGSGEGHRAGPGLCTGAASQSGGWPEGQSHKCGRSPQAEACGSDPVGLWGPSDCCARVTSLAATRGWEEEGTGLGRPPGTQSNVPQETWTSVGRLAQPGCPRARAGALVVQGWRGAGVGQAAGSQAGPHPCTKDRRGGRGPCPGPWSRSAGGLSCARGICPLCMADFLPQGAELP